MKGSTIAAVPEISTSSLRQLTTLEARRSLRRVSIWIGFALTIVLISGDSSQDWSSGSYTEKMPLSFLPLAIGTFFAAFRTGCRDTNHDPSSAAPLGPDHRATARIAIVGLPVFLTIVVTAAFSVVSRIEGGFWLGDGSRRTDTAIHSLPELLQPALFIALVGVVGIAIGRTRARLTIPLGILFGVVIFMTFGAYWVWNTPPGHAMALIQSQPMFIDLDPGTAIANLPADWYVEEGPTRQLVHIPTVLGHNVYLLGLISLIAGLAIRTGDGRTLRSCGAVLVVAGIAFQLLVSPL